MKKEKIPLIVASAVFVVLSAGLITGVSTGTLSGFGWDTVSVLCPLGSLEVMIASKTVIPRAVASLALAAAFAFVLGRAFCGYACPVVVLKAVKRFFTSGKKRRQQQEQRTSEVRQIAQRQIVAQSGCAGSRASCGSCAPGEKPRGKFDTRHAVLLGALSTTFIFGFPVFCLVCPVGLTFATVMVLWRLFAVGDATLSAVLIPAVLVVELVFLRKWCTRFCPLAALMNLVSRFGRTFVPVIDEAKCIEATKGNACSKCAEVCDAGINLRHPEYGDRALPDCTRCRACVTNCPMGAVSMPFLRREASGSGESKARMQINDRIGK